MKSSTTSQDHKISGLPGVPKYLSLAMLFIGLLGATAYLMATGAEGVNPLAEFWRQIRQGEAGYTAVSSAGHNVLIQNGGEIWREVRNLLFIEVSPWLMGGVIIAIAIFHLINGGDKLEESRTGILLHRYSLGERFLHWYTAILFIVLAITGLSILLGRAGLLPMLGHGPFATYLASAKLIHNWSGPFFLVGVVLMFIIWLRENFIHKLDIIWFKNMGGMIGDSPRPHSQKNNGGEKAWFWLIAFFGLAIGISGIILDFPIWGQSRLTMQISLVVHTVVAVLFVTASFGHIYMGTLGSEGAFAAMWRGSVDSSWAKQHCDLWFKKKAAEDPRLDPEDSRTVV